jgi:outer membrane lipoprotein-sorting protein
VKKVMFVPLALMVAFAVSVSGCSKKAETTEAGQTPPPSSTAISESSLSDIVKKADSLTTYAYTYSIGSNGKTSEYKIYVKDKKVRMDFGSESDGSKMSYIVNGKSLFMYVADQKTATKMKYDSDTDPTEGLRPYSAQTVIGKDDLDTLNKIGRENVNGIDCNIYEYGVTGAGSTKIYVSREYGVLIKMVSSDADKKDVMSFEIKDMSIGNIDDSVFELPKGTKVTDLSSMGS